MSQISKCPNVTYVLTYWEAQREVSELSYKSLLYFSSNGLYCSIVYCKCQCIIAAAAKTTGISQRGRDTVPKFTPAITCVVIFGAVFFPLKNTRRGKSEHFGGKFWGNLELSFDQIL